MLTEHLNARINPGVSKTRGGGRVRVRVKLGLGLVLALTLKQHSLKKKTDLGPDPAPVFGVSVKRRLVPCERT